MKDAYEYAQTLEMPRKLFDITCHVGSVWEDLNSQHTPREAAFNLIATHNADGHYQFPLENGDVLHVTVETETIG